MLLLLQIAVILVAAGVMRRLFAPLGQPAVVGEMVAGLMLGPSCFGWLAPGWSAALFPASALEPLNALSQLGLVLFMLLVGRRVASHASTAKPAVMVVTSVASMVVPFAAGAWLATTLYSRFAPAGTSLLPFVLFIGAAMSITAFPVLARILIDRRLLETDIGTIAITCAAFDDVMGWLTLAVILSLTHVGAGGPLWPRAAWFVLYLAGMAGVVRPLLARLARRRRSLDQTADDLAVILIVALLSAAATDAIGVHALFGAFVAGLILPTRENDEGRLAGALEPVTMMVLLPLFFALTGLRTTLQSIVTSGALGTTAVVLVAAVAAKGGVSALAARAMGLEWRKAGAIGVLLNTRGLVELVILNIGLEAGILSPVVFSMFVLMTFVTTLMTSPLLERLLPGPTSFRQTPPPDRRSA